MTNIKIIIEEGIVDARQVGYIVGLYPTYQKQQQNVKKPASVTDWVDSWGDGPIAIDNRDAVVTNVKIIDGNYGAVAMIFLKFDNNISAVWKYSGAQRVEKDDKLSMTGHIEKNDYFTPPRIKFVANRSWMKKSLPDQLEAIDSQKP